MRMIQALLFFLVSVAAVAQTNAPAPAITGVDAIDSVINASPIILVAVAIQLIGIAIQKMDKIPNAVLPMLNLVLGGAAYPAVLGQWSFKNVLFGVLAGAGATGIYEVFKQFRPTQPQPPSPPTP